MSKDNDTIQDAITVLTERMHHYPSEFLDGRFKQVFEQVQRSRLSECDETFKDPLWFLDREEKDRLFASARDVLRHDYVQHVMSKLVEPETPYQAEKEMAQQYASSLGGGGWPNQLGSALGGGNGPNKLESALLKAEEAKAAKRQYDAYSRQQNERLFR